MAEIIIKRPLSTTRWRWDTINGTRTGPFADGNYPISQTYLHKLLINTPNFGYYVQNGIFKPNNTYLHQKEKAAMPNGDSHLHLIWIPTGDFSDYNGPVPVSDSWNDIRYLEPTTAERTAIYDELGRRLLSKVKGQKVNLGNFLAERNQTISLFGDTAKRIAKAVNALRAKKFKEAFRALRCPPSKRVNASKSLANNWLELQYGWLPLLDDCYGAAEELERAFDRDRVKPPIFKVTAKRAWAASDVYASVSVIGASAKRDAIMNFSRWCYYTVDYESSQFLGRVGLTNPLDIAWEATPWSFVVDWFYPVGKFLNTLDATLGCTYVGGGNNGILYSHLDYSRKADYSVGNYRYVWNINNVHARWFSFERGGAGGFPAVTLPQLKNPLSAGHCANALALMAQAFSRK